MTYPGERRPSVSIFHERAKTLEPDARDLKALHKSKHGDQNVGKHAIIKPVRDSRAAQSATAEPEKASAVLGILSQSRYVEVQLTDIALKTEHTPSANLNWAQYAPLCGKLTWKNAQAEHAAQSYVGGAIDLKLENHKARNDGTKEVNCTYPLCLQWSRTSPGQSSVPRFLERNALQHLEKKCRETVQDQYGHDYPDKDVKDGLESMCDEPIIPAEILAYEFPDVKTTCNKDNVEGQECPQDAELVFLFIYDLLQPDPYFESFATDELDEVRRI
ncbi:MAG: hypothetical protein Q9162_006417 [Coniocarpon cinnabarinum]